MKALKFNEDGSIVCRMMPEIGMKLDKNDFTSFISFFTHKTNIDDINKVRSYLLHEKRKHKPPGRQEDYDIYRHEQHYYEKKIYDRESKQIVNLDFHYEDVINRRMYKYNSSLESN